MARAWCRSTLLIPFFGTFDQNVSALGLQLDRQDPGTMQQRPERGSFSNKISARAGGKPRGLDRIRESRQKGLGETCL